MANYVYSSGGLAAGLAQGIQSGLDLGKAMKQQALESDLADASKVQLEEVPGADGAPSTWKMGDQTYSAKPETYQVDYDRAHQMAGIYESHGQIDKAIATRTAASQGRELAQNAAIEKEMADAASGSASGSIVKANQDAQATYEKQMADWKAANANAGAAPAADGTTPAAPAAPATPAPVAPTLQRPNHIDWLNDIGTQLQIRAKHGKLDPQTAMQYAQTVDTVKKEGAVDALNLLNAGDIQGAIKKFNESGDTRIDPASVTPRQVETDVNGTKVKTWEITVKNPDGTTTVVNAAKGLQGLDKIDKTVNMVLNAHQDQRAAAADGRAATTFGQAQEDRKAGIAGNVALGGIQAPDMMANPDIAKYVGIKGVDAVLPVAQRQAQTKTFGIDNPNARPDQTALVNVGLPQVAEKSVDQTIRGDVAVQNNPTATPTTIQAIAKGVDPTLGNEGAKGQAAAALYKERFPDASPQELRAAQLGVIKVEDGMTSSFTPNQMLGGGVIQQKDRHGNIWVTDVSPKGEYSETRYIAAPSAPGAAAKPGASSGASSSADNKTPQYKEGTVVNLKNGGKGVVEKVNGELKIRPL